MFFFMHLSTSKRLTGIHDLPLQNSNSAVSKHTGDRADHMYDKVHALQQQQRRVMQTLHRTTPLHPPIPHHLKARKLYPNNISHNINHALVQCQSNPRTIYFLFFFS